MVFVQRRDTVAFDQSYAGLSTSSFTANTHSSPHDDHGTFSFLAERTGALRLRFRSSEGDTGSDSIFMYDSAEPLSPASPASLPSPLYAQPPCVLGVPSLPPELIARVLHHVVSSAHTRSEWVANLQQCALVSRAWLPLARSHLFHTLVVSNSHKRRCFTQFVRLLNDGYSAGMRYWVRELEIKADWNLSRPDKAMDAFSMSFVLARLENLRSVSASGLRYASSSVVVPTHTLGASGIPGFSTLKRLRIADIRAWTSFAVDVLSVLDLFSELDELVFDSIGEFKDSVLFANGMTGFPEEHIDTMRNFIPRQLAVRDLTLTAVAQMDLFLHVFRHTRVVETLRSLVTSCEHATHIESFARDLGTFLADTPAASHITQLGIELADCFRTSLFAQVAADANVIRHMLLPALSRLRALRTFGILVLFPHDPTTPGELWSLVLAAVYALPRTVRRVQICLHMDVWSAKPSEAAPFPWDAPWLAPRLDWVSLRRALGRLDELEALSFMKRVSGIPPTFHPLTEKEQECIALNLPEVRDMLIFDLEQL